MTPQWTQMASWSELRHPGDWILERRHWKDTPDDPTSPVFLCVMDPREEAVTVPPVIVAACMAAGIKIKDSYDWDRN